MVANDRTKLYLGSGNTLYYPREAMTINSFRAYFLLADGITAGNPVHGEHRVKAFLLNFNGLQSVGIIDATSSDYEDSVNDKWFTIDGRKRSGKPNQKGVYIHNGRCVIGLP